MATVNPGYMGWANFGGTQFRFTDCNVSAKQDINAPDLITGHWNRQAYNYGKVDIGGTISGPVGELFAAGTGSIWSKAVTRNDCGELDEETLDVHYYCGTGSSSINDIKFAGAKVNSVTFSCAAGDVAQFSVDLIGKGQPEYNSGSGGTFETPEKLVTWDKVSLTVTPGAGGTQSFGAELFSNFEVTFGNNVEAVYALGTGDLFPYALVDGLTTITGSVSVYNIPGMLGVNDWGSYEANPAAGNCGTISFSVGGTPMTLNVRWHRVEPTASVGPIISTVAFTGVTTQPI